MLNEKININATLEDQCLQFGKLLELGKPVAPQVLISAIHNDDYARSLIANKRSPFHLNKLLANPPVVESKHKPEHHHTSGELIASAAKALIKWGKTGFMKVDAKVLEKRENACLSCPNMVDPDKLIQKILPSKSISNKTGERTGKHVCDFCGCHISKKIQLISESCPDEHPTKSGFTRWDEPI
ncbi:MAG: hypothetical protein JW995_15745 [Melioribacteraceae bacterium]|nr:hypothetical protein [Melioribacteraceae bacterium]